MPLPTLNNDRFTPDTGLRITVQVPDTHAQAIVEAVLGVDVLKYGDYDSVTFKTTPGVQQFRALGTGRNSATKAVVEVPCTELSVFIGPDDATCTAALKAIYAAHPYEEPVIFVTPCLRTLHIRGLDEDNPNRFWNSAAPDWVPDEHK